MVNALLFQRLIVFRAKLFEFCLANICLRAPCPYGLMWGPPRFSCPRSLRRVRLIPMAWAFICGNSVLSVR